MSKMPAFMRGSGQSFMRSPGQARGMSITNAESLYSVLVAAAPLCGFGTLSGYSTGGGLPGLFVTFNEVWPFVYKTLTETWIQSDGNNYYRTQAFDDYNTTAAVSTHSDGSGASVDSVISATVTSASAVITYWANSSHTVTGTYTATLSSGPITASDWAAYATRAQDILDAVPLRPISDAACFSTIATKTDATTLNTNTVTLPTAYLLAASAYGYPCRLLTGSMDQLIPIAASILEAKYSTTAPTFAPNLGAVVSVKSQWLLTGVAPSAVYPNTNDHKNIYAQSFSPSTVALSSVSAATSISPNPVVPRVVKNFYPSDIAANGMTYGVLGFRSPAA